MFMGILGLRNRAVLLAKSNMKVVLYSRLFCNHKQHVLLYKNYFKKYETINLRLSMEKFETKHCLNIFLKLMSHAI